MFGHEKKHQYLIEVSVYDTLHRGRKRVEMTEARDRSPKPQFQPQIHVSGKVRIRWLDGFLMAKEY